jgi:hypothetical protein
MSDLQRRNDSEKSVAIAHGWPCDDRFVGHRFRHPALLGTRCRFGAHRRLPVNLGHTRPGKLVPKLQEV